MKVLILGCGPAGLIAAQSAMDAGASVAIASKKRKSFMNGAQYLHRPIPNVDCGEPFQVEYILRGSAIQYRQKVYGKNWNGTVSPEDLSSSHSAWDIRRAYDQLWDRFEGKITDWDASPAQLTKFQNDEPDTMIVSSIPAPVLCHDQHSFRTTEIWSTDDKGADSLGLAVPVNTVVCNGEESPRWYRAANIQGYTTIEWPGSSEAPPIAPMWRVPKPTTSNCDCFPDVLRVGRYGRWEKGVLSHEAYAQVSTKIQERF